MKVSTRTSDERDGLGRTADERDGLGRTVEELVAELDAILRERRVHSVYQPIVDLTTSAVVAYEALARGPRESPLESPGNLFEAARRAGRLAELDWLCRIAAVRGAVEAGLRPPLPLFVNVVPQTLHRPVPADLKAGWSACDRLRIVLEVTERALTLDPAELSWNLGWARDLGWGIALDDVGADPRSISLLELVRPDFVKLDLSLLLGGPAPARLGVVHAVAAYAERSGSAVVAEGIETEADLETALAAGATLGQGWRLGHPRPLPDDLPRRGVPVHTGHRAWSVPVGFTPFDMVRDRRRVRRTTKAVLCAMSRGLEHEARALPEPPVVIAAFQDDRFFTGASRDLYMSLGRGCAFVAALGAGMSPLPAPGVRGVRLATRDPLRDEWVVIVLGSYFCAALAARDLGDESPDGDRRFDYVMTYERELVSDVARSLLARAMAD